MKSMTQQISGNAFSITLTPESDEEIKLMENGTDQDTIERYYHDAITESLGRHISPASLTPGEDYPYHATVELFSDAGSVI